MPQVSAVNLTEALALHASSSLSSHCPQPHSAAAATLQATRPSPPHSTASVRANPLALASDYEPPNRCLNLFHALINWFLVSSADEMVLFQAESSPRGRPPAAAPSPPCACSFLSRAVSTTMYLYGSHTSHVTRHTSPTHIPPHTSPLPPTPSLQIRQQISGGLVPIRRVTLQSHAFYAIAVDGVGGREVAAGSAEYGYVVTHTHTHTYTHTHT